MELYCPYEFSKSSCLFEQALADAGLAWDGDKISDLDKSRCGILIGSAMGGMMTFSQAIDDLVTKVCPGGIQGL